MCPLLHSDSHHESLKFTNKTWITGMMKEFFAQSWAAGSLYVTNMFPWFVLQGSSWHGHSICIHFFFLKTHTHLQGQEGNAGVFMMVTDIAKYPSTECVGVRSVLEQVPNHWGCETHHFLWDGSQEAVFSTFWSPGANPAGKEQDGLELVL